MEKSLDDIGTQVVNTSGPKTCISPDCGIEEPVLRDREYLRKVKDLSIENPTLLLVHRIKSSIDRWKQKEADQ